MAANGLDDFFAGFDQPVTAPPVPRPALLLPRGRKWCWGSTRPTPRRWRGTYRRGVTPPTGPATCIAWVCNYPFTTFGTYNEAILIIQAEFQEFETYLYCPFGTPTPTRRWPPGVSSGVGRRSSPTAASATAGRSLATAKASLAVDRPTDKRLLTVTMTPERPATAMEDIGATPHT